MDNTNTNNTILSEDNELEISVQPENAIILSNDKILEKIDQINTNTNDIKTINSEIDTMNDTISNLADGSPKGVFDNVAALVAGNPASGVYLTTDNGHIYSWMKDGTTAVDLGIYQAVEIEKNSILFDYLNPELQDIINNESLNIYHRPTYEIDKYVNLSDGKVLISSNAIGLELNVDEGLVIEIDIKKYNSINNSKPVIYGGYIVDEISIETLRFNCGDIPVTSDEYSQMLKLYNKYTGTYYFIIPAKTCDYFLLNTKVNAYDINDYIKIYPLKNFFNKKYISKISNIFENDDVMRNNYNLTNNNMDIEGYISTQENALYKFGISYATGYKHRVTFGEIKDTNLHIYFRCLEGAPTNLNIVCNTYDNMLNIINTYRLPLIGEDVDIDGIQYKHAVLDISDTEKYYAFTYALHNVNSNVYQFLLEYFVFNKEQDTFKVTDINGTPIYLPNINNKEKVGFTNWYAIGDSITEKNFRALYNYLDWCNNDLDINIINLGISGTGYKKTDKPFYTRLDEITSYNSETDIITVMGSINDMSFVSENLGVLGDKTIDTIYGAMYLFFNTLFTKFNGARVGIITPIPSSGSKDNVIWDNYRKALIDTAKEFNIPILDITDICNLRPWEENFRNEFFLADGEGNTSQVDGTHPNSKGHKLFYSRIKEFIKNL